MVIAIKATVGEAQAEPVVIETTAAEIAWMLADTLTGSPTWFATTRGSGRPRADGSRGACQAAELTRRSPPWRSPRSSGPTARGSQTGSTSARRERPIGRSDSAPSSIVKHASHRLRHHARKLRPHRVQAAPAMTDAEFDEVEDALDQQP